MAFGYAVFQHLKVNSTDVHDDKSFAFHAVPYALAQHARREASQPSLTLAPASLRLPLPRTTWWISLRRLGGG